MLQMEFHVTLKVGEVRTERALCAGQGPGGVSQRGPSTRRGQGESPGLGHLSGVRRGPLIQVPATRHRERRGAEQEGSWLESGKQALPWGVRGGDCVERGNEERLVNEEGSEEKSEQKCT